MVQTIGLYGMDRNSKESEFYIFSGSKFQGQISFDGTHRISEALEPLGIDSGHFIDMFKGGECILELEDVKWLRDFAQTAIKTIEEKTDLEHIKKESMKFTKGSNIYDRLSHFEVACLDAWANLQNVLAICNKALELKVKLLYTS